MIVVTLAITMTMAIGSVGNRTEERRTKTEQNRTGENRGEDPDQRVAVVAQGETDHTLQSLEILSSSS